LTAKFLVLMSLTEYRAHVEFCKGTGLL